MGHDDTISDFSIGVRKQLTVRYQTSADVIKLKGHGCILLSCAWPGSAYRSVIIVAAKARLQDIAPVHMPACMLYVTEYCMC